MVLLADFVEPLHQLRIAGNAEIFAPGEPELLIDEIAEQILVGGGDLLHGGSSVLASLLVNLSHGAVVVRAGNDLIVYAGNDVFDRRATIGALGRDVLGMRQHGTSEQHCTEDEGCGNA